MKKISASILVLLILLTIACASSAYQEAVQYEHSQAIGYKEAFDVVQNMRGVGRVNGAQWSRFLTAAEEVRAAGIQVDQDLDQWRDSGKKPAGYDQHSAALHAAHGKVLGLAAEVSL